MSKIAKAAAAAIGAGAVIAAIAVGGDPKDPAQRGEFVETAVALRGMGVDIDDVKGAISARSGATQVDVDDVVSKSVGKRDRDSRSLRSTDLTILVPAVQSKAAWLAWGTAWCEPLTGLPQQARCLASNTVDPQGAPMCNAIGIVVGYVARTPATAKQTQRAIAALDTIADVIVGDGAAEIAAKRWQACPEPS